MDQTLAHSNGSVQTSVEIMLPAELTAACSNQYWSKVLSPSSRSVVFNAQNVKICDESGIALLFQINHAGPNVKLINIPQDIQQVYVTMTKNMVAQAPAPKKKRRICCCLWRMAQYFPSGNQGKFNFLRRKSLRHLLSIHTSSALPS